MQFKNIYLQLINILKFDSDWLIIIQFISITDISNSIYISDLAYINNINLLEYIIKDILIKFKIFKLYKKSKNKTV